MELSSHLSTVRRPLQFGATTFDRTNDSTTNDCCFTADDSRVLSSSTTNPSDSFTVETFDAKRTKLTSPYTIGYHHHHHDHHHNNYQPPPPQSPSTTTTREDKDDNK
ncbi:hypothetical protein M0802_001525 [Mischocyttarus mexicanus]|nr:hypothetical protein M0802_001525 [Mischocyttarus mexicanus]